MYPPLLYDNILYSAMLNFVKSLYSEPLIDHLTAANVKADVLRQIGPWK